MAVFSTLPAVVPGAGVNFQESRTFKLPLRNTLSGGRFRKSAYLKVSNFRHGRVSDSSVLETSVGFRIGLCVVPNRGWVGMVILGQKTWTLSRGGCVAWNICPPGN